MEIIDNIFSEEERKKLIDLSQPLLVPSERLQASAFENGYPRKFYPGKQSFPTVHLHPDFQYYFNHILFARWKSSIYKKIPSKKLEV